MKVKEIMTEKVVTIHPRASIADVAKRMKNEKVRSLLVTEGDKLVGVITDSDISHKVVAEGWDPQKVEVRQFMNTDFVAVHPDMDLLKAAKLLEELAERRLPVVLEGRPVGVISIADIAHFIKGCIDCVLVESGMSIREPKK